MVSEDILNRPVEPHEVTEVVTRYQGAAMSAGPTTIGSLSEVLRMKPLLVARAISDIRGSSDPDLVEAIKRNDFLILKLGTARLSHEVVEGDRRLLDKFWRNNDPLGVYRPGDMWYVDENHKWMRFFPLLILAPSAFLLLFPLVSALMRYMQPGP